MNAMAIALSPTTINEAKKVATDHVASGQRRLSWATALGYGVDSLSARIVNKVNVRLERDLVRIRGLASLVPDIEPSRLLDERGDFAKGLGELQSAIHGLHVHSLKARDGVKWSRTHEALRQCVEWCVALYESVGELKRVIADHDSKATMSDDARRLMADLKRTDDVPAGRYAELSAVLRRAPAAGASTRRVMR